LGPQVVSGAHRRPPGCGRWLRAVGLVPDAGTLSPALTPVFYAVAMAVSGAGSLILGKVFDRAGIGVLIPLAAIPLILIVRARTRPAAPQTGN
jgi:hypothetical protein